MPAGISLKPTPTTRSESRRQAYNTPRKIRCIYYLEMAEPTWERRSILPFPSGNYCPALFGSGSNNSRSGIFFLIGPLKACNITVR